MATWKDVIQLEMNLYHDSFSNITHGTMPIQDIDQKFDKYDAENKIDKFYIWTIRRVYGLASTDIGAYIISMPRNPDNFSIDYRKAD